MSQETDLNKFWTYFCIPFKCNVLCIKNVCILVYVYLNKILFTLTSLFRRVAELVVVYNIDI